MSNLPPCAPLQQAENLVQIPTQVTEFDFANALANWLPPIKTCGRQWFAHSIGAYRETSRDTYRPFAQNVLPPALRTARRERALLDHLEGRFQTPREELAGAILFSDDGAILINAINGVVKVTPQNVALLPHSPDWPFTRSLAASFDESAKCTLFRRILEQALPDENDRCLAQLGGANFLFPDSRYEVAMVWFGEGGTGKSTIAGAIEAVLGTGLVTHLTLSQICDPKSYSLPQFQFAAVNLGTELDSLAVDESSNFKTVVSGEPMEVRPIYGRPYTLRPNCKLWFLANALPRFKNGNAGELRRTRFIRFEQKPSKIDVSLKSRLLGETSGVLNFLIHGLQELMAMDEIPLGGPRSREVHERFAASNDPIGAFIRDRCELQPDGKTRKDLLHDAFAEFCTDNNLHAELPAQFLKRLYERHPSIKGVKARVGNERLPMLSGIRIKQ